MKKRFALKLVAACAIALGATGSFAQGVIKIANIVELSGGGATAGTNFKNGVEMAVKEINAAGGILGRVGHGPYGRHRSDRWHRRLTDITPPLEFAPTKGSPDALPDDPGEVSNGQDESDQAAWPNHRSHNLTPHHARFTHV